MFGQSSHHLLWCRQTRGNLGATRARLEKRANPRHLISWRSTLRTSPLYTVSNELEIVRDYVLSHNLLRGNDYAH